MLVPSIDYLRCDPAAIPPELQAVARWVGWKAIQKSAEAKPDKVPFRTDLLNTHASSTDPETWGTFEQAVTALEEDGSELTGIGFVLNGDGIVGVDIDHCVDPATREVNPAAVTLLDSLQAGYVELSPSGTGLRAFGYAEPLDRGRKGKLNGLDVEFYSTGRYLTVTGHVVKAGSVSAFVGFADHAARLDTGKKKDPVTGAYVAAPGDERLAGLLQRIRSGDVFHDSLRDLAASLVATGLVQGAAVNLLRALMDDSDAPRDERWEARMKDIPNLVRSACDKYEPASAPTADISKLIQNLGINAAFINAPNATAGGTPDRPSGFTFKQGRDLLAQPKPIPWLIRGMIEQGALAEIFGQSGCGKSFMVIDWGCCIATGTQWCGKDVEQGSVFYIAGEGHAGIGRRIRAWEIHSGVSLADAPIFFSTAPAALMDSSSAENVATAVEALVAEHGHPKLIIVDTLARNLGCGEENSNADIGLFINNIDVNLRSRFGATVLIVHHTGHLEKDRSRGASALRAAMDSEYRLDVAGDIRTLVCTKAKESEPSPPLGFKMEQIVLDGWTDEDGELMTSAVLVSSSKTSKVKDKDAVLKGANRIALDALAHALQADGKPPEEPIPGMTGILAPPRVVPEDVWRQRAYDEGISEGEQEAKKKAFARSRKALLDMSKISVWKDMYWLGGGANEVPA